MAKYRITLRDEAFLYLYKIFASHLQGVNMALDTSESDFEFKKLVKEHNLAIEVINAVKDARKLEGTNG